MKPLLDGRQNGEGIRWPDEKRVAVMITFDFDAEFLRISRAARKGTTIGFTDYSRGQYGPHAGIYRCLDLIDVCGVPATFFVPGIVAETYPEQVREIHLRGHEIACHGYMHESKRGLSRAEEEETLRKSEDALFAVTGVRPVGHRAPESILQTSTVALLHDRGYLYSSSMKDCDWAYLHAPEGREIPLVEFPTDVMMDDFTYYYFTFSDPAVRAMYQNSEVVGNWRAEFDALCREGDKIFVLKLHPQLIGRASRIAMLREFIAYMQRRGAWFASCAQAARYVLSQSGMEAVK